jgi:hypothetical protein
LGRRRRGIPGRIVTTYLSLTFSIDPFEQGESESKPKATLISKKKERKKSTKSTSNNPSPLKKGESVVEIDSSNTTETSSGAFQTAVGVKPKKASSSKKEDAGAAKKSSGKRKSESTSVDGSTPKKKQKKLKENLETDKTKKAASSSSSKGASSSSGSLKPLSAAVKSEMDALKKKASERMYSFLRVDSFAEKKHFPDSLRPPMLSAATVANDLDALDDNFFAHLQKILPYNSVTIKKLVERLLKNNRTEVLEKSIDGLYVTIKDAVDLEMKSVDLVALKAAIPAAVGDEVKSESMILGGLYGLDPRRPKESKWGNVFKDALYHVVKEELEKGELFNQLQELKKDVAKREAAISENSIRKQVYTKLVGFYPEGYITTTDLSRVLTNVGGLFFNCESIKRR